MFDIRQTGHYGTWEIHTERGTVIGGFTSQEAAEVYCKLHPNHAK